MTRYWIVVDKAHEGPFTLEELVALHVSPETYAWYPGLPKWTRVKDIPELADAIAVAAEAEVAETEVPAVEPDPVPASVPPVPPPPPPLRVSTQPVQPQPVMEMKETKCENEEKRPANYLAWSIITTILFFLPLGIVAIIFSSKVNGQWALGKREEARKSSELAAWFSNIAFVVGLIWYPFSVALAMIL